MYSLLGQIHLIIIQLQYNYNTIWPLYLIILIACQIYINNKRISSGYDWLSFIYHHTTMSEPSCRPIRKYFAKNAEYDEEEGICFTFNKTYNSIFFLSTSLKSTPVSPPNHSKKYHQCDHIRKQLGLGNLMSTFFALNWIDFFIAYLSLTNNKQAKFFFFKKKKWLLKLRDNLMGAFLIITTMFLHGGRSVPAF